MQHLDEGQEQRAIETVLVEIVRRHIRGRHHDHAAIEKLREQPAEDHRVGNVGDVEFVEAEQPGVLRDRFAGEHDRVLVDNLAGLGFLAEFENALVHLLHEFMEMHAPLLLHAARVVEQVHQHGLAAPDLAVDVEALQRRLFLAIAEQPAERGRFRGAPIIRKPLFEGVEFFDRSKLRGVGRDRAFRKKFGVAGGDGRNHAGIGTRGRAAQP